MHRAFALLPIALITIAACADDAVSPRLDALKPQATLNYDRGTCAGTVTVTLYTERDQPTPTNNAPIGSGGFTGRAVYTYTSMTGTPSLVYQWRGTSADGRNTARATLRTPRAACPGFDWTIDGFDILPGNQCVMGSPTGVTGAPRVGSFVSYASYDGEVGANTCDGEGNGGPREGGTQYDNGDYTGGETVDWQTGVGNGGTSACGSNAQVEYICIDIVSSDGTREYACGWATTC